MRLELSICALGLLAGCTSHDRTDASRGTVREISVPAEVGSGEPNLSTAEDAIVLSWLEAAPEGGHDLWMARLDASGRWEGRRRVVHGDSLFVNWADFPSVTVGGDGRLWAHWLRRRPGAGLAYDIRLSHSADAGETWSDATTPHDDGTPTEHGFVSVIPEPSGVSLVWLDGRAYAPSVEGGEPAREMSLRARAISSRSSLEDEVLLDDRTCDCCQTDAARTADGLVVVYRNRTEDEVRDIYVTRRTALGWTPGVPVHRDGWVIAGCPVNGPAVDASGNQVAVAWFTGEGNIPRVFVAFSTDGGVTFADPIRVDGGSPAGRLDLRLRADGTALVSWLERTGADGAELRLGRYGPQGQEGEAIVVSSSSTARASGFPRMVAAPWNPDEVLLAWTDVSDPDASQVRLVSVETSQR